MRAEICRHVYICFVQPKPLLLYETNCVFWGIANYGPIDRRVRWKVIKHVLQISILHDYGFIHLIFHAKPIACGLVLPISLWALNYTGITKTNLVG